MGSDSRRKAWDLFRLAREAERSELRNRLLALAQLWLRLADHEQKVRQLAAEIERLSNTEAPHERSETSDQPN